MDDSSFRALRESQKLSAAHATSYGAATSSAAAPAASAQLTPAHPSPATPAVDALFASAAEQHSLLDCADLPLPSVEELEALERRASIGVAALQDLFNIGTCESTCLPGKTTGTIMPHTAHCFFCFCA
jgi:hypothetical protein